MSPIICREVEQGLTLEQLRTYALAPSPTVVLDGVPKDFAFTPIHQYGDLLECRSFDSPSALLDFFFTSACGWRGSRAAAPICFTT